MSELSRAQVEELAQRAAAWTDGVEIAAWLVTDAALRAQLAAITDLVGEENWSLREQLIASQANVTALAQRIEAEEPIFHAMVQQLAALELANTTLQEEVTKLEKMLYPGGT